jgi:hypothetical protein
VELGSGNELFVVLRRVLLINRRAVANAGRDAEQNHAVLCASFVVGFTIVTPAASFGRKRLSQPHRLFAGRLTANGSSLVRERGMKRR